MSRLLLLLFLYAAGAGAADANYCDPIINDAERLDCYDRAVERSRSYDQWEYIDEPDEISGNVVPRVVKLSEIDDVDRLDDVGGLVVFCVKPRLGIQLSSKHYIDSNDTRVVFRVDENKPISSTWNIPEIMSKSIYYDGFVTPVLQEMLNGDYLRLRYRAGIRTIDLKFRLRGIRKVIKPVLIACGYDLESP